MSKLLRNKNTSSLLAEIFYNSAGSGGGSGVQYLNDLLDVSVPTPNNGQVLTYDANTSMWVAADASGTPAPPDGAIQFNKNGSFGGDSNFIFDYTDNVFLANSRTVIGTTDPNYAADGLLVLRSDVSNPNNNNVVQIRANNDSVLLAFKDGNAYLGLGTNNPSVNLHVVGVGQNWSGLLMDGTDYASIRMRTSDADFMWSSVPNSLLVLYEWSKNRYHMAIDTDAHFKIGQYATTLEPTAVLEVADTGELTGDHRGSLPAPRIDDASRDSITNPACGLTIYNTDSRRYEVYNCTAGSWQKIPVGLPNDNYVLYSKNGDIAGEGEFTYDDVANRLFVRKIAVNSTSLPNDTSVFLAGDGTNPMYFLNDLGTNSDGFKIIALFSRHTPGPGNAGFYAGYYVSNGDVDYTLLFAPGARDFGVTTYASGNGISEPTLFVQDSGQRVGIHTKAPNAKLHVKSDIGRTAIFESPLSYGTVHLIVPGVASGKRATFYAGTSPGASTGANFAYQHQSTSSQRAAEIYVGSSPPADSVARIRVAPTQVQLQTADVLITRSTTTVGSWSRLAYMHGNPVTAPIDIKLLLASRPRDTYGRSDFTIAVNNATTSGVEADETGDSVFFVDGITRNIGIRNTNPKTTFDIWGAYRAQEEVIPPYTDYARFTYLKYQRDFIQQGHTAVPEFFRHIYEMVPSLQEIDSFFDVDMWDETSGEYPDFGIWDKPWEVSGSLEIFGRWGWGMLLHLTAGNKEYAAKDTGEMTAKYDYTFIIPFDIISTPSFGTKGKILTLASTAAHSDDFELYYINGSLRFRDITANTELTLDNVTTNDRLVVGMRLSADTTRAVVYLAKISGSTYTVVHQELNSVTINDGEVYNMTIGYKDGDEPVEIYVPMFTVISTGSKAGDRELMRIVKKIMRLYN